MIMLGVLLQPRGRAVPTKLLNRTHHPTPFTFIHRPQLKCPGVPGAQLLNYRAKITTSKAQSQKQQHLQLTMNCSLVQLLCHKTPPIINPILLIKMLRPLILPLDLQQPWNLLSLTTSNMAIVRKIDRPVTLNHPQRNLGNLILLCK